MSLMAYRDAALYATPKDVLLGLTDQQFKAMSEAKWSVMVGSLFMGTRDKNGQSPDYGASRAQALSPTSTASRPTPSCSAGPRACR